MKNLKMTTTKFIIFFLFINCIFVQLFCCAATWRSLEVAEITSISPDFTALVTLVGSIVTETIAYAIYCLKSVKENCKGGIIYDSIINDSEPKG